MQFDTRGLVLCLLQAYFGIQYRETDTEGEQDGLTKGPVQIPLRARQRNDNTHSIIFFKVHSTRWWIFQFYSLSLHWSKLAETNPI